MGTKYYAVVSGRKPGIYTDWPTAESMVKGFPGAIFKSFHNKTEAEVFMSKSTANTSGGSVTSPQTLPLIDKTIIYTDGSFVENTSGRSCGFGVVVISSKGDKITAHGRVPLPPTNNVAELYAIYVGLSLVKGNAVLYSDSRYAISCLTSYIHDWQNTGWSGVANRELIEATYQLMQGREVMMEHVPAHSGIKYNEDADKLANMGRMGSDNLVIIKNNVLVSKQ
ncbi:Ribonuclease H [uncultured virus]|nr:Ribonuclease H [uncultured virus]